MAQLLRNGSGQAVASPARTQDEGVRHDRGADIPAVSMTPSAPPNDGTKLSQMTARQSGGNRPLSTRKALLITRDTERRQLRALWEFPVGNCVAPAVIKSDAAPLNRCHQDIEIPI